MAGINGKKHEQCLQLVSPVENIVKCIEEGHPTLCLLRGASGSGKTMLAERLTKHSKRYLIVRLEELNGGVVRDYSEEELEGLLPKLFKKVRQSLQDQVPLIVVDFEHIELEHIKCSAETACREAYEIYVIEPETDWRHCPEQCTLLSPRSQSIEAISKKIDIIKNVVPTFANIGVGKNIIINNYNLVPALDPPIRTTTEELNNLSLLKQDDPLLDVDLEDESYLSPLSTFFFNKEMKKIEKQAVDTPSQVFSLVPHDRRIKMVDMGTSVCFMDLGKHMGGMREDFIDDILTVGDTKMIEPAIQKPLTVERATQADDESFPSFQEPNYIKELAMLQSLFFDSNFKNLRHCYYTLGYEQTFQYLTESHGLISWVTVSTELLYYFIEEAEATESGTKVIGTYSGENARNVRKLMEKLEKNPIKQPEPFKYVTDDTTNDEEIARRLQEQFEKEERVETPTWRMVDESNLKKLEKAFPGLAREVVAGVYNTERNYQAAYSTLHIFISSDEPKPSVVPSASASPLSVAAVTKRLPPPAQRQSPRPSGSGGVIDLTRTVVSKQYSLEDAHADVRKYRSDIDQLNRHLNEVKNSKTIYKETQTSEIYGRIRKVNAKIDECIERGNSDWSSIDLHGMSPAGAAKFVLKVYKHAKQGASFNVITGAGRNSNNNFAALKSNVHSVLNERGIAFSVQNDGCIKIKKR